MIQKLFKPQYGGVEKSNTWVLYRRHVALFHSYQTSTSNTSYTNHVGCGVYKYVSSLNVKTNNLKRLLCHCFAHMTEIIFQLSFSFVSRAGFVHEPRSFILFLPCACTHSVMPMCIQAVLYCISTMNYMGRLCPEGLTFLD